VRWCRKKFTFAISSPDEFLYFIESGHASLMGYDLISASSLVIDSEHRCVWSRLANSYVAGEVTAPFLETEPMSPRTPCTLRGDIPLFEPSVFQFRNVHESCQAITVTPVTPSSFPRSEPYAGP